jgi:hypothetical protein
MAFFSISDIFLAGPGNFSPFSDENFSYFFQDGWLSVLMAGRGIQAGYTAIILGDFSTFGAVNDFHFLSTSSKKSLFQGTRDTH